MSRPINQYQLRTIAECWAYFREQVTPPDFPPIMVEQAEMCFYTGAAFVFDQNIAIGADDVTAQQGLEHLDRLQAELNAYREQLAARIASRQRPGRPN